VFEHGLALPQLCIRHSYIFAAPNRGGEGKLNFVSALANYILSLALTGFPPGAKIHSLEPMPECGTDPKQPTCELAPVCDEVSLLCAAPRFEPEMNAWVRVESRDAGARRLEVVAKALADAALYAGAGWRDGPVDLARAMLAASGWSTGLREDIQVGRTRGRAGEVCLMDIQPTVLRSAVPWDLSQLEEEALVQKVVGLEYPELRRCFDAGAVLLLRARRWSREHCESWPEDYAFFSAYGPSCHTLGRLGDYARLRARTYQKFRATRMTVFPEWYRPSKRPRADEGSQAALN
jgi:hypothetical protein